MPERVKQQAPCRLRMLGATTGEQPFDRLRSAGLLDTRLARHQRPEHRATARDPFTDRHGKSALCLEGFRFGKLVVQPLTQQPLPEIAADLELVAKAEGNLGHARIEERLPNDPA